MVEIPRGLAIVMYIVTILISIYVVIKVIIKPERRKWDTLIVKCAVVIEYIQAAIAFIALVISIECLMVLASGPKTADDYYVSQYRDYTIAYRYTEVTNIEMEETGKILFDTPNGVIKTQGTVVLSTGDTDRIKVFGLTKSSRRGEEPYVYWFVFPANTYIPDYIPEKQNNIMISLLPESIIEELSRENGDNQGNTQPLRIEIEP